MTVVLGQAAFTPSSLCNIPHGWFQRDFLVLLWCSPTGTVLAGGIPAHTSIHIPLITEHLSVMDCRGFSPDLMLNSCKYNFSLCISKFACLLTTSSVSLGQLVLAAKG